MTYRSLLAAALTLLCWTSAAAQTVPANAAPAALPQQSTSEKAFTPGATTYQIRPGDQLAVSVFGDASLSQTVTVLPDGTVTYPLAGRILVAGATPQEASTAIAHALERYVRRPQVTVNVAQQGVTDVTVMGNVKTPGRYQLRGGARLTDAIAAAGGVNAMEGVYPQARVSRADGSIETASLQQLFKDGNAAQNLPVDENSIVYVVGGETFHVQVLGAIDRPGNVEVHEGDRLSVVLARAGSSAAAHSDLNRVFLRRPAPSGQLTSYEINVYQGLEKGDLRYDPLMRAGDVVFVPESRQIKAGTPIFLLLSRLIGL